VDIGGGETAVIAKIIETMCAVIAKIIETLCAVIAKIIETAVIAKVLFYHLQQMDLHDTFSNCGNFNKEYHFLPSNSDLQLLLKVNIIYKNLYIRGDKNKLVTNVSL